MEIILNVVDLAFETGRCRS